MYEFIKPDDNLLDLGIGTGASSILFHKAGLNIFGADSAEEMLKVCESKEIACELKCHDLQISPFPYQNSSFHHIVSIGVFDHFQKLKHIFEEISRILVKGGMFAFTVQDLKNGMESKYVRFSSGFEIPLYRYSERYLTKLFAECGFILKKYVEFECRKEKIKAYIIQKEK